MPTPVVYLANNAGGDILYLTGINEPWPQDPVMPAERAGSTHRMIPGWDTSLSQVAPGEHVFFDFGWTDSARKLEVSFYADQTLVNTLYTRYTTPGPFRYSADNGVTQWRVVWQPGNSLDVQNHEGFPGHFKVTLRLQVMQKL